MKKKYRSIAVFAAGLTALFTVTAAIPQYSALFFKKSSDPVVSAFSKSDVSGASVTFTADDFTSRVTGKGELDGIVISALPDESTGVLMIAGRSAAVGEQISMDAIGTMSFTPVSTQDTHTSFSFLPVFAKSDEAYDEPVTVSINLSNTANASPIALNLELDTYTNLSLNGNFRAVDLDNDPCTYNLVSKPEKGEVTIIGDQFCYQPVDGKSGSDSFTYLALDQYGNPSAEATVDVTIHKRPANDVWTYSDLGSSTAHYAALRLAEEGIFVGERIGQECFLYPAKNVSRAEFVTMVATLTEMAMPTAAISTGLADNADIPTWAQPYIVSAITSDVVKGVNLDDGNKVFMAENTISVAEAAAILDRALNLSNESLDLMAFNSDEVPTWAQQSVVNTAANGILDVSTLSPAAAVTREDAVNMLYQALSYIENSNQSGGILSLFK